jgi:hypothetical protein
MMFQTEFLTNESPKKKKITKSIHHENIEGSFLFYRRFV